VLGIYRIPVKFKSDWSQTWPDLGTGTRPGRTWELEPDLAGLGKWSQTWPDLGTETMLEPALETKFSEHVFGSHGSMPEALKI